MEQLKFYYNYKKHELPVNLQSLEIYENSQIHPYNTRTKHQIYRHRSTTKAQTNGIVHQISNTINFLSSNIKDKIRTHTLKAVLNYAKNNFILKYEVACSQDKCYICNQVLQLMKE